MCHPSRLRCFLRERLADGRRERVEYNAPARDEHEEHLVRSHDQLASLMQIDYMFFEKDNGMVNCENQKLKITYTI